MIGAMAQTYGRPYGRRDRVAAPYRLPQVIESSSLVQTKVRLSPTLHRALHERAAEEGISVSAFVARLIAREAGLPDPLDAA
jgi:hypothetical protein